MLIETRWIAAAGTLVNLLVAALLWVVLRRVECFSVAIRYFLVLYFLETSSQAQDIFSSRVLLGSATGIRLFEDRIHTDYSGLAWWCRWVSSYLAAMMLVARQLRPFVSDRARATKLTWTRHFIEGALAAIAGLPNPAGPIYVLLSALPATLGSNSGLLGIRYYMAPPCEDEQLDGIPRSYGWIAAAVVCGMIFIFIIGRGVTWHR